MKLVLIGMNHKTAPLEIRERLSLSFEDGIDPLKEIMKLPLMMEAFYLSTCNRVEVLANATEVEEAIRDLKNFIFRHGNLSAIELEQCLYVYCDQEAVRHLFRVTSSIDSMIMGEPQILGQVKDAYRRAVEANTSGVILNKILHHAFRAAKRVRTETGIAHNAVSVSFAAIELAKKIFGTLQGKTVLLIGAGEMSELAARHLFDRGVGRLYIANRTYERALRMAEAVQGVAVRFEQVAEKLRDADIVISSTGASGYILTEQMVAATLHRKKNRLLFLVDIAVPRDIEPTAGDIDNVYLYNIDDLQGVVDENLQSRKREVQKAETIIDEEVLKHLAWINTLQVVPTIVSLREKANAIMKGELEKTASWTQNLTKEDRKQIEVLITSIINKILHDPITSLKEESQDQIAVPYIAALRRLFRLDGS
jgi:glutamyl-tRNA reductase